MNISQPLISVLIPSYNHQNYIRETVESIRNQPYQNIEIVIVDDCSTDSSCKVLEHLSGEPGVPIRLYLNEQNRGVVATINSALKRAQGDLVVLFASDDLFCANRFEAQLGLFSENPDLKIVYANGRVLKDGEKGRQLHDARVWELLRKTPDEIRRYLYTNASPLFLQTALIKRSLLLSIGGFDETALADDWLLNAKFFSSMRSNREYAYVDQDVVLYRHHDANIHRDFARQSRLKLEFIERFTPRQLKSKGFSNIHYDLARLALKNNLKKTALKHFIASQYAQFSMKRMKFIGKYLRRVCS